MTLIAAATRATATAASTATTTAAAATATTTAAAATATTTAAASTATTTAANATANATAATTAADTAATIGRAGVGARAVLIVAIAARPHLGQDVGVVLLGQRLVGGLEQGVFAVDVGLVLTGEAFG
jgi:hypothetical protein